MASLEEKARVIIMKEVIFVQENVLKNLEWLVLNKELDD
jgi:hypothetical protein